MTDELVISSEELKKRLDANNVEFMFDLRNADEFKAWRIEGRQNFNALNIPQEEFVGEEERHLSKFPKDKQIVVVCAHGDSSKYSAEVLQSHGLNAVGLMGGMDSWSEFYETHKVAETPLIFQTYRVARGCMTHIVVSQGSAVVIDAVRHIDQILDLTSSLKVKITHVFDTHLQADHISGGPELARRSGAVYHMNRADAEGAALQYTPLIDGETITFGSCTLDVIYSPGHTPGSTSLLLDRTYLFTGDIIMKTSIGRPDLGGKADEWSSFLYYTLFSRFEKLADDIIVLPSHAASIREQDDTKVVRTSMGQARKESELYQLRDKAAFTNYITTNLLENPERYQEIRKVNLGLLNPDDAKRKELEIGKNLCGMAKKK